MRTEIKTWTKGTIPVNRISLKHGHSRLAYLDYVLDHNVKRAYIKGLFVDEKHRNKGNAQKLIMILLDLTPMDWKVHPIEAISLEGRQLWKKARLWSDRIIPITKVEAEKLPKSENGNTFITPPTRWNDKKMYRRWAEENPPAKNA